MKRHVISLVLVLCLWVTMIPIGVYAAYEAEPNNDYKTATVIDLNTEVSASFSEGEIDFDWYKTSLTKSGAVKLSFNMPAESGLAVHVYCVNTSGEIDQIYSTSFGSVYKAVVDYVLLTCDTVYLPAGDYYIQIYSLMRTAGDYTMTAEFTANGERKSELEPNNDYKLSTSINANALYDASFAGKNNDNRDTDWYKLTTTQSTVLRFQIKIPTKVLCEIRIHKVNNAGVLEMIYHNYYPNIDSTLEYITQTTNSVNVNAGIYYVELYGYDSSSDSKRDSGYSLQVLDPNAPSSWALDQVNAAIAANLVPQSLQSKYGHPTTRAEFCTLATALYESVNGEIKDRKTFSDTTDINVQKMASLGVVSGVGGNRFDPGASLTREQAAAMLARLADAVGKPLSAKGSTFADNSVISSWALDSVGKVQAAGITGGIRKQHLFSKRCVHKRTEYSDNIAYAGLICVNAEVICCV